jgi:hypothetical protein
VGPSEGMLAGIDHVIRCWWTINDLGDLASPDQRQEVAMAITLMMFGVIFGLVGASEALV